MPLNTIASGVAADVITTFLSDKFMEKYTAISKVQF